LSNQKKRLNFVKQIRKSPETFFENLNPTETVVTK